MMSTEQLEEFLIEREKKYGCDYDSLKEFLSLNPQTRVAYLLKFVYYSSRYNEQIYKDFCKKYEIDSYIVFNYEIKMRQYPAFKILDKIINENYTIERKDITNFSEYNELYQVLCSFMHDIRVLGETSELLEVIYKRLEDNIKIVKKYSLESFDSIYQRTSNPFKNDEFLLKCIKRMDTDGNIDCSKIFLDDDKRAGNSNTLKLDDYYKMSIEFIRKYINIILKLYGSVERKKYFEEEFLEYMDDSLMSELKNITDEELKVIVSLSCNLESRQNITEYIKGKSKKFYEFMNNLAPLYFISENESYTYPFKYEDNCGEAFSRIYLNLPGYEKNQYCILQELILKCAEAGFVPRMKAEYSRDPKNDKDSTIIYVRHGKLSFVLNVLKEMRQEHPDWFSTVGSPLWYCGEIDGFSLAHMGDVTLSVNKTNNEMFLGNKSLSFTGYSDKLYRMAYKKMQEEISNMNRKPTNNERIILYKKYLYLLHNEYQRGSRQIVSDKYYDYVNSGCKIPPFIKKLVLHPIGKKIENGSRDFCIEKYSLEERRKNWLLDRLFKNKCMEMENVLGKKR